MNCPYFKEGYFGICDAPDAIHVPSIVEMESFCFKAHHKACPNFSCVKKVRVGIERGSLCTAHMSYRGGRTP